MTQVLIGAEGKVKNAEVKNMEVKKVEVKKMEVQQQHFPRLRMRIISAAVSVY